MDICESILERKRHDSERSACSLLELNDIEAVEALVCMSSWGQRPQAGDLWKMRPLTPVSDSGDVAAPLLVDEATPELPKDLHSLSTLVRGGGRRGVCSGQRAWNTCAEGCVGRVPGRLASKGTASPVEGLR